jgi:hypothetical protein
MAGNNPITEVTFHKNATSISDGIIQSILSDANTMNIDFMGSGTFTALIQGKTSYESDKFDDIMGVNLATYDMTTTPNTFDTYQIDVTAWSYIRVKLTSVTGNITVIGRLVG